jgi:ferredoxin
MVSLRINDTEISVHEGTTVLQAATGLGIDIPTMCYLDGHHCHPSCMVCLVSDAKTGKLFTSCAMPVAEGMQVITNSQEVLEARCDALELLLSEHVGDCEAPCRLSCPAFMDIPEMNRLIASGNLERALEVVREDIALPLVMGYICPAPCEKACYRKKIDGAVSICLLKRIAAVENPGIIPTPKYSQSSGKSVAIIGTGPAGLSAAFYLLRAGHSCILYDKNELPGGSLRYAVPDDRLPKEMLDIDIDVIRKMGGAFRMNTEITPKLYNEIVESTDAVIIAVGHRLAESMSEFSFELDPKVFVCANIIHKHSMAISSAAMGKRIALETDHFLTGKTSVPRIKFNSKINHLTSSELEEYLKESKPVQRTEPMNGFINGFRLEEAKAEASRCMHCDCRKAKDCKLRVYSDAFHADRKKYAGTTRKQFTKEFQHEEIVFEPQKCIRCGLCIEIAGRDKETAGLTYIGRGFALEIGIPFNKSLNVTLTRMAADCVKACPTAALAFKKD